MMKRAKLYRMVTKDHICPYGLKSKDLLESEGYEVEDYKLLTKEKAERFKEAHNVKTTPQTFINEKHIGGFDDLVEYFDKFSLKQEGETYQPIIAIFSITFLMSLAFSFLLFKTIIPLFTLEFFVAISMCVLALLKIRDLYSFSNNFITYDIIGMRVIKYSYIYPFLELIVGLGMIARVFIPAIAIISISIGLIGSISVIKAVYIEKRDLKCACVGGDSNVPLGFVSLSENLMMFFMGIWMLITF